MIQTSKGVVVRFNPAGGGQTSMAICYYITAHGLGHAVRSSVILNALPADIPVIVRSEVSPQLLREEIRRPFELFPASFDCGAVQKDGFTVDPEATLHSYSKVAACNSDRLAAEIDFLKSQGVRLVVSDVASFPMRVARCAGLPGVVVGNFTWADIYEPFTQQSPEHSGLYETMLGEYALATCTLRLPFSCPMKGAVNVTDVPLVCRTATSMRPALAGFLDLDPSDRWVLLYLGQYPVEFDWSRLSRMKNTRFLSISERCAQYEGVVFVDPTRFDVADVVASCDAALGKPGYGTIADCVSGNTPIVYALPSGFAETDALDCELTEWGRCVRVDRETLFAGDIRPAIDRAITSAARKSYPQNGAERVVSSLLGLL